MFATLRQLLSGAMFAAFSTLQQFTSLLWSLTNHPPLLKLAMLLLSRCSRCCACGLELLLHPELGQNLSDAERIALIQKHQRPQPRLDVLPILGSYGVSPRVAGMDSSDGLADALVQLCQASGVGAIDCHRIPPIPVGSLSWFPQSKP